MGLATPRFVRGGGALAHGADGVGVRAHVLTASARKVSSTEPVPKGSGEARVRRPVRQEVSVRLPRLRVAQACDVPFASMDPRGEGRHCARCDRVVADLSAMTRRQAVALFRARGGDLCGYLAHDGAGLPVHAPERGPSLLASAAVATLLAACEPTSPGASEPAPSAVHASARTEPLPPPALMRPIDPAAGGSGPIAAPPAARPAPEVEPAAVSLEPLEIVPSAEDRALERRKRAARRPRRPPPHTAFAGMMVLDD